GANRHLAMQGGMLGGVADATTGFERRRREVEPVHQGLARGGREDPGEDAQGGRLAGAVRSQEPHHLPAHDPKRDVPDDRATAEALGEAPGFDHPTASRTGCCSTAPTRRAERKRGRTTFTQAGTSTSPPKVLNTIRSASSSPTSAENVRSENPQKSGPASMVVAVKMIALPVVAVA